MIGYDVLLVANTFNTTKSAINSLLHIARMSTHKHPHIHYVQPHYILQCHTCKENTLQLRYETMTQIKKKSNAQQYNNSTTTTIQDNT